MKGMPDRLKKYKQVGQAVCLFIVIINILHCFDYQDAMDRKPKKDIFQLMKRIATLSREHGGGGSEVAATPAKKKK